MTIWVFVTVSGTVYTLSKPHDWSPMMLLTGMSGGAGQVFIMGDNLPEPKVGERYFTDKCGGLRTTKVQYVSIMQGV